VQWVRGFVAGEEDIRRRKELAGHPYYILAFA
jgi:hypothetical protein